MNVLITGAGGLVGSRLVPALTPQHELRLLRRRHRPGDDRWHQVDIANIDEVSQATAGIDAVIHLAIATGQEGQDEDDAFNGQRFDTNVKGTYNVFEAARRHGVKRVIYTSSLTVVWGYAPPTWVSGDAPARPVGTYGLTKYLGEQIGRHYANEHGLPVLCMRVPKPVDLDDTNAKQSGVQPQWMAFPDLIAAYQLALEADWSGFETITLAGESTKRRWDLSRARMVLGYKPTIWLERMGYRLNDEPADYHSLMGWRNHAR